MKKEITKQEYHSLAGLLHLGQQAEEQINEYIKAGRKILELPPNNLGSHFEDGIFNNYTIDEVLEKENIKVKGEE